MSAENAEGEMNKILIFDNAVYVRSFDSSSNTP